MVASFSPTSAYPGQKVTLNGTNFSGATRVLINGGPAVFEPATNANFLDLQLTVAVSDTATTGLIAVETPHGNATTSMNLTVLTLPRLAIQALPGKLVELSWPATPAFNVQRSDTLGPSAAWTAPSFVSTRVVNGIRYGAVTNAVPNRFFRLYRP